MAPDVQGKQRKPSSELPNEKASQHFDKTGDVGGNKAKNPEAITTRGHMFIKLSSCLPKISGSGEGSAQHISQLDIMYPDV